MLQPSEPTLMVIDGLHVAQKCSKDKHDFDEFLHDLQSFASITETTSLLLSPSNKQPAGDVVEHVVVDVTTVISDVMMPRMSGLELLDQIRKAKNGAPNVISMSGVNPTRTRSTAKWDDFIEKPFNLDTLLDTVNRQLRR